VKNLGIPAKFIPQGDASKILAALGLDADGIASAVRSLV
jgi:deoxyxylulose-5-phosphate synthase